MWESYVDSLIEGEEVPCNMFWFSPKPCSPHPLTQSQALSDAAANPVDKEDALALIAKLTAGTGAAGNEKYT